MFRIGVKFRPLLKKLKQKIKLPAQAMRPQKRGYLQGVLLLIHSRMKKFRFGLQIMF